jgi:hypothetical protein
MTIAQINSTKTEFTFYGNDNRPRTIWAKTLLNAKKNHNKRFKANDVNEIHFNNNVITGNEFKLYSDGFKNWNLITKDGHKVFNTRLNKIDSFVM